MSLSSLIFWVSPLSHELFVGRGANGVAREKREITGLMINGVIEVMRMRKLPYVEVTQGDTRYRLSLEEVDA